MSEKDDSVFSSNISVLMATMGLWDYKTMIQMNVVLGYSLIEYSIKPYEENPFDILSYGKSELQAAKVGLSAKF